MLVLSRKLDQAITVDGPATIKILEITKSTVKLGIGAERTVTVMRSEIEQKERAA